MRRALAAVALAAAVATAVPAATADVVGAEHVQVLTLDDLHGALDRAARTRRAGPATSTRRPPTSRPEADLDRA